MGLEHGSWNQPLKMGREDCDSLMKPENVREYTAVSPLFVMVPQHSRKYARLLLYLQ